MRNKNFHSEPNSLRQDPTLNEFIQSDFKGRVAEQQQFREWFLKIAVPLAMLAGFLIFWSVGIRVLEIPPYILPGPEAVVQSLIRDWPILGPALVVTLEVTFMALVLALVGGVFFAILMTQSRWLEYALYPFAVVLQVTPIIAIAPLILIYAPSTQVALLICAFLVSFFPILSNMIQGLRSTDHNLLNLMELYGANRWQTLRFLKLPNAMPYFLTGFQIAGGLSLIAAVVAEFAAGSAGAGSGLAFRLFEAQFRRNMPRLFAALLLLSIAGIAIFALTSFISWLILRRWHESSIEREN